MSKRQTEPTLGPRQIYGVTTTPRDPKRGNLGDRGRAALPPRSPFGQTVDMYVVWEQRMKAALLAKIAEARAGQAEEE